jgi:uncharacterized protein
MGFSIRKLVNANVYLNGVSYAGLASEVTLPEVKAITKDHQPSSMAGKIKVPMGLDEMTLTIKGDFDAAFVAASADIYHVQLLQIRCNLPGYDESGRAIEQSVVAHIRALPTGHKPGAVKGQEPSEFEYTFNVWAYKLEVDGVPIYDLGLTTNKHQVLGKNLLSTANDNLGV